MILGTLQCTKHPYLKGKQEFIYIPGCPKLQDDCVAKFPPNQTGRKASIYLYDQITSVYSVTTASMRTYTDSIWMRSPDMLIPSEIFFLNKQLLKHPMGTYIQTDPRGIYIYGEIRMLNN